MKETFSTDDIDEIILDNQETVNSRGDSFGVQRDLLDAIFEKVNDCDDVTDHRVRIIRKAAHLLGGMSFVQPFNDGNKETALSITIYFLQQNGFDLPLDTHEQKKEVYDLLIKTIFKFESDPTIISEVETFLLKNVVENPN